MASENGDMINEDWANLSYYKEEKFKTSSGRDKRGHYFYG